MNDTTTSADRQSGGLPRWLGPAALVAVPALSVLLLLSRAVWDVDVFWQLRLGELILAHGGPLTREPFAASHFGEPLPTLAWAGQALYGTARQAGGWGLLRELDALAWLGGFWGAAWGARRRGASAACVALALALGLIAALPQASLRPQSLAALCFGLLIALTFSRLRPVARLMLAGVLLVAWQNLHPSVAIAAVWLGGVAGARWLAWPRDRGRPLPWEPTLLGAAAVLAMAATPEGLGILSLSAANAQISRALGVSEWLPLWAPVNRQVAVPVIVVALITGWLVRRTRRLAMEEVLPMLALLALTVIGYRFVLFWAIALVPVIARAVPPGEERPVPRWAPVAAVALAGLAGALLPTHFAPDIPLAAIERLRAAGAKGTIYAHFPWGGPLIDAGYPAWRVAYDGRYYRYTPAEWHAYAAAGQGDLSLARLEARWHPGAFLLSPQWNGALIAALRADRARWRELPGKGSAIAFVPVSRPQ